MLNMVRADLFKMRKSPAMKILFAITAICSAGMLTIAYLIAQGSISAESAGVGFLFSDVNVISILGAVIAGIFICGDYDNKTIHEAITSGSRRSSIITGKALAFFCGIIFILLPYIVLTFIALATGSGFNMGAVSIGFLNILSAESGAAFTDSTLLKLLAPAFALVMTYAAQLSICVPLAFLIKKPVAVVGIFYGISISGGRLTALQNSYPVLKNIVSWTPFGADYMFLTSASETGVIIKAILVSIIFIAVTVGITYGIFKKSEIR